MAAGRLDCALRVVVSNRAGAPGLARAAAAGIPTRVIDHKSFARREDFDRAVVAALREAGVELVLLAGVDPPVTPGLSGALPLRIMNIPPARLPSLTGL